MLESSEQDRLSRKHFPGVNSKLNRQLEGAGAGEAPQPQSLHIVKGGEEQTPIRNQPRNPTVYRGREAVLWVPAGTPTPRAAPSLAPCEGEGTGQLRPQLSHPSPGCFLWPKFPQSHRASGSQISWREQVSPPLFTQGGPRTAAALGGAKRDLSEGTFALSPRGPDTDTPSLPSTSFSGTKIGHPLRLGLTTILYD